MSGWVAPTAAYVLAIGALGVTSKLALDHISWQSLIAWTMVVYIIVGVALMAGGTASLSPGPGTPVALLSGALAVGGLIALYVALGRGDVSLVVPVSSVYPIVTAVLGALVLAERVTLGRALGVLVVVTGLVIVTRG